MPNERINKPKSSRPKKRSNGSDKAAQTTCKDSQWDPLTGGAKTCTLHLSTVLFTLYYPSAVEGEAADSYDRAAWLGRCVRRCADEWALHPVGADVAPLGRSGGDSVLSFAT